MRISLHARSDRVLMLLQVLPDVIEEDLVLLDHLLADQGPVLDHSRLRAYKGRGDVVVL